MCVLQIDRRINCYFAKRLSSLPYSYRWNHSAKKLTFSPFTCFMYLLSRLLAARECYYAVKCLVFKTLIRKETEATLFCFYSRRKVFAFLSSVH